MNLSDFPPDVQAAVATAFPVGGLDSRRRVIALAIMAERERCALIVDQKARDLKVNDLSARQHRARQEAEGYAYASERCVEVAAAIRSPQPSPNPRSMTMPPKDYAPPDAPIRKRIPIDLPDEFGADTDGYGERAIALIAAAFSGAMAVIIIIAIINWAGGWA
jgi:hypothetical protein